MTEPLNIANRLTASAARWPDQIAVVQPNGRDSAGQYRYRTWTFSQLEREATAIANGLLAWGVQPGQRLVLMVRPSFEFIALTFGLMRAGIVVVLIDPGMGRSNIFRCLEEINPDGFVAIPIVQAIRVLRRRQFPNARFNVTVGGRKWLWGGKTYSDLLAESRKPRADRRDTVFQMPAAIIFTSGSTGPPKGVVYEHGMFDAQVDLLRDFNGIQPGEIDLPGFPLFGLFNAAMGVTTVIPDMNPTKPAQVNPTRILAHLRDWNVTQAFGSPAIWNRVGRYCEATGEKLPSTLHRVLSAGAPVPVHVIERMRRAFSNPEADIHTPYGATESLPVASICGREVLEQTASRSRQGAGTCVGRTFPGIDVKIVQITDGPIASLSDARELPHGEIGEIIVRGPSTTREYFQRPEATAAAKIPDATDSRPSPLAPPSTIAWETSAISTRRADCGSVGGRRTSSRPSSAGCSRFRARRFSTIIRECFGRRWWELARNRSSDRSSSSNRKRGSFLSRPPIENISVRSCWTSAEPIQSRPRSTRFCFIGRCRWISGTASKSFARSWDRGLRKN